MPNYITQAVIASNDSISANFATNTWSISALTLTDLDLANAAIATFYTSIDNFFSNLARAANGLELVSYDRADLKPRAPVRQGFTALVLGGSTPLPPEIALCCSFQAAKASGLNQARRRGRIYLPFMDEANNGTDGRPSTTLIAGVVSAAAAFVAASDTATGWGWDVWSTVNNAPAAVTDGWVDNEWDVQRRRGRLSTTRNIWT